MDYRSSLVATKDAFVRLASQSNVMVQSMNSLIEKINRDEPCNLESSVISHLHEEADRLYGELMTASSNLVAPMFEIPWLDTVRSKLQMSHVAGNNPWDFTLTYSDKKHMNTICEILQTKFNHNNLTKLANPPEEGQLVVCYAAKTLFRAKVLKSCKGSGRFRVLKIDSNEEVMVQSSSIFQVPLEVATIPCQALWCCINKEDQHLENRWVKDLQLIFSESLRENQLTVDILEKLNCFDPPKFHVRIYAYNEDVLEEKNLSLWINDKLLTDLKKLTINEVENVFDVLSQESLDPFYKSEHSSYDTRQTEADSVNPRTQNTVTPPVLEENEILDEPDPFLVQMSVQKVSSWMNQNSGEKETELNKIPSFVEPKWEEPSFSKPKSWVNEAVRGNVQISPVVNHPPPIGHDSPTASSSRILPVPTSNKLSTKLFETTKKSSMSPQAKEFVPSCHVEVVPGANEESVANVISNLEDEYQPKDEQRICKFFQKNGFCKRTGCTKEHKQRTNNWTDDTVETVLAPYNLIDLPREGSEAVLNVQHVESANTFFATLHDLYSDINEYGVRETLTSLCADLNSCDTSSPHPLQENLPARSEMVVALGIQRMLGPKRKWLRAKVVEIMDMCTVTVFFVDFGNEDTISTSDIRQIRPQFLHLPAQAVRITLSMLEIVPEHKNAGKSFLSKQIKGKAVKAKIVDRDVINSEMEALVYLEDNTCINDIMVSKNYCISVRRTASLLNE